MDIRYSPAVQRQPALLGRLRPISAQLSDVIGPKTFSPVTAEWDVAATSEGERYRLALEDSVGRATAEFTAEELARPLTVQGRLYDLWRALLQVRADIHRARAEKLYAELVTE